MVRSNSIPSPIQVVKDKIYIRQNIQEITETDEMSGESVTLYEYNEIIVQGYSAEFITNRIEDVFANPTKYNVILNNGIKEKNPKGIKFAELQEQELVGLENTVDFLILDNLTLTDAVDQLILDSLGV